MEHDEEFWGWVKPIIIPNQKGEAMSELRFLSPLGMLGIGIPAESFREGLRREPHLIAADAGSTDAGPHKLGRGVPEVSREVTKRDLSLMLEGASRNDIPIIVGSAGGSGAKVHVEWTLDIVREIAKEKGFHLKMAVIWADIDKDYLRKKLREGKIGPLGPAPPLTEEIIEDTVRVVGVMGAEPIIRALQTDANLIICGRSLDSAIFSALGLMRGYDPGLCWHMGEILECGAQCAYPMGPNDSVFGYLREDHFVVEPLNPKRRCTPLSIASHSLYERSHPFLNEGPEHILDLSSSKFEAVDERSVKVSGSKAIKKNHFKVKLEGSAKVGYRTLVIAGIRDPIAIQQIEEIMAAVRKGVTGYFMDISPEDYNIFFHVYGKDGVMGKLEPVKEITSHELGIVLDVVAKTQELSNILCAYARGLMVHYHYTGCMATAANLAFPTAPSDISFGPVFKFSVLHLVEVEDPCELFPMEIVEL